jgi:hypothetical protein
MFCTASTVQIDGNRSMDTVFHDIGVVLDAALANKVRSWLSGNGPNMCRRGKSSSTSPTQAKQPVKSD